MVPLIFIFVMLCSILGLTGCSNSVNTSNTASNSNTYQQITAEEAANMMQSETDYIILDVRTAQEYESGHIPGAVNLPNETIISEAIQQLPDKEQLILVYCRSGNRSKQASKKLVDLGYTNIVEFGGINDWSGRGCYLVAYNRTNRCFETLSIFIAMDKVFR